MYTPVHFQPGDEAAALEAIQRWPLAMLASDGPAVTHLPMLRDGDTLIGHVAIGNDHWKRAADGAAAVAAFTGPDAYISPGFYATKAEHGRVVPTWNYVAVHVHGAVSWVHEADAKLAIVRALTDHFERREMKPWSVDDAPADYIQAMLRGIVPLMEKHFGIRVLDEAITEAVRLSHRYISGRQLPDKAVGVLDTA